MSIHPSAVISSGAAIHESAEIGPYCVIGEKVTIGPNVRLHAHVIIDGRTTIGADCVVHAFAVIGGPPQHLAYRGEDTALEIGARCIIREHVTMNIGTVAGRGVTVVGEGCLFMAASHVAHDSIVGKGAIFANNATIGGHVIVEEGAFLGGLSAVHQFCRVGAYAFVGGCAAVPSDVIPYGSAVGNHAELAGLNLVGLKRRGVSREAIRGLRAAFRELFEGEGAFRERLESVDEKYGARGEVARVLAFIRADTRRPLMAPRRSHHAS